MDKKDLNSILNTVILNYKTINIFYYIYIDLFEFTITPFIIVLLIGLIPGV